MKLLSHMEPADSGDEAANSRGSRRYPPNTAPYPPADTRVGNFVRKKLCGGLFRVSA